VSELGSPSRRGLAYGVTVVGLIVLTGGGTVPFIYFQF
jgi:hypothetical protein